MQIKDTSAYYNVVKTISSLFKQLEDPKLRLFGIAVGLTLLQLGLTWKRGGDFDRLIVNSLFAYTLLSLLWKKKDNLNLESGIFSSVCGLLLIALVLVKSISLFWFEYSFARIIPLILAIGFGLLASGIKGLKQYWRELIIVVALMLPEDILPAILEQVLKVSELTAQFAVFVLWYTGFPAYRQGVNVILTHGAVAVEHPCTGLVPALLLLKLSVLFIFMFPIDKNKKILVPIAAVLIAFITSGFRVALMALVVSDHDAFAYWHGSEGNQIFSTIAMFVFVLFCKFLLQQAKTASQDSLELQ